MINDNAVMSYWNELEHLVLCTWDPKSITMSQFRAYCLDENNAIIAGQDVEAPDLTLAIQAARTICARAVSSGNSAKNRR